MLRNSFVRHVDPAHLERREQHAAERRAAWKGMPWHQKEKETSAQPVAPAVK